MAETEKTYPLFIYGTLRPGQPLWPHLKDSVVGNAAQAWIKGHRMAYSMAGSYPVVIAVPGAHRPGNKIVRGTLVNVRNTAEFQAIWNMEVRAGYTAEKVQVFTGIDVDHLRYRVEAFCFTWDDYDMRLDRGDIVPPVFHKSGLVEYDWARDVERQRRLIPGPEEVQSIPSQKPLAKHS